jgi:hypothetical protein
MDELNSPPSVNDTLWKTFDVPIMRQNVSVAQERFRMLVVVVGLFLNTLVVLVVSGSRQLRYPRHVFWAAISLFECLFLAECVLELAVIVYKNHSACRVFVLLASVDYSILLVCLSLAAFDRYLSIVRYEWYKKSVTVGGVVWLLSLASLLTFVIVTGPFWTGYLSIHTCTVNLAHVYYVFAWDLCLGILCVILHFKIFVESKDLIRQYKSSYRREPMTVRFINHSTIRPSITDLAGIKLYLCNVF